MSRLANVICFGLLSIVLLACDDGDTGDEVGDSDTDTDDTDSDNPDVCCSAEKIINCGHRGTGTNSAENPFPENTIPSFLQAEKEGAQMIELDVVHTQDGAVVVIHDQDLERTTDGTGCAGDMTLEQLKNLDAASGTSMEGTGIQIPTLEEALAAIGVDVNVEIKVSAGTNCPNTDVARLAADVVTAIESDTKDRSIIVSSFSADVLGEVKKANSNVYAGFLSFLAGAGAADNAKQAGFDAFHVKSSAINEENISSLLSSGIDINVWTVNSQEEMEQFFEWGVDMIITDEPQVLESARDSWCEDKCP